MYEFKCCICGLNVPELLEAAHIRSWAEDINNRLNPENGVALCVLHHKAYDRGLIKIVNGRVKCSETLSHNSSEAVQRLLLAYNNKEIAKPVKPLKEVLKEISQ